MAKTTRIITEKTIGMNPIVFADILVTNALRIAKSATATPSSVILRSNSKRVLNIRNDSASGSSTPCEF